MENFPKVYNIKMALEEKFLRLAKKYVFKKNEFLKNVNFLILLFSQEVIITCLSRKKFTFPNILLEFRRRPSGGIGIRTEKEIFSPVQ